MNPCGRLQDGFRLQLGSQEFDSLLFGDTLYREVAVHIRRLRRGGAQYPVYLTGVVGAEGDGSRQCGLVELLRTKQLVEQRLAEAMR